MRSGFRQGAWQTEDLAEAVRYGSYSGRYHIFSVGQNKQRALDAKDQEAKEKITASFSRLIQAL